MFEEAQLYSPVTLDDDGRVEVHLGKDHPGFNDPAYRERRNAIAARAMAWTPGEPVPQVDYTEAEHEIWRLVSHDLHGKHLKYACQEFLDGKERLGLPEDRIAQLDEVTQGLAPLSGFSYVCAPGLVPLREFYGALADRQFHSTQYVRHPAEPLYTPEPDVIHEVIGHGNLLASPRFAEIKRLAGEAVRRVETDAAVQFIADVFWFSMEFGVVHENGELQGLRRRHLVQLRRDRGVPPASRSVRSTSPRWARSTTTSPATSPSCTPPSRWPTSRTSVGGFFASADDDDPGAAGARSKPVLTARRRLPPGRAAPRRSRRSGARGRPGAPRGSNGRRRPARSVRRIGLSDPGAM